jgi:hypothetical protein
VRTYVQIDLETLGRRSSTCPVLTLGAVAYRYGQGVISEFTQAFDLDEQIQLGRRVEADAFVFWLRQPEESRQDLHRILNGVTVDEMEDELFAWWETISQGLGEEEGPYVLSMGANFDIAILEGLLTNVPWSYKNTMCWRSLRTLYRGKTRYPEDQIRHTALGDARAQAGAHLSLMDKYEVLR